MRDVHRLISDGMSQKEPVAFFLRPHLIDQVSGRISPVITYLNDLLILKGIKDRIPVKAHLRKSPGRKAYVFSGAEQGVWRAAE